MMALLLTGVLSLNVATPGAVRAAVVAAPRAIQPTMLLSPLKAALFLNAAVETANGVIYLVKPLRNNMIKAAFGISAPDEQSALAGAFQTIGGLHAAAAFQCITALLGRRSAKETLVAMIALWAIQAAVQLSRALAARAAGALTFEEEGISELWAFLGAGGGPAVAASVLGLGSLAALGA